MAKVVGIDLGTTFTVTAHFNSETGRPEILVDADSQERLTPSVVLFEDKSRVLVGTLAKQNAIIEPEHVVEYVKRQMGKPLGRPPEGWCFSVEGQNYNAQEISAMILAKVKKDAEAYLNEPVSQAVITVPAYFGEAQRAATAEAGRIAGLEVLSILDEPVAAALAYSMDHLEQNQTIFVFDLGGGTLDVSIIEIRDRIIREVAINGDHLLGGKNFDDVIITWASTEFIKRYNSNPQEDPESYQDLQLRAVQAKQELTRRNATRLVVAHRGVRLTLELTKQQYEQMTAPLVERCRALCEAVMADAGLDWREIDRVIPVGGSTRMPCIQDLLTELSRKPLSKELHPDECVALGAAWAAMKITVDGQGAEWISLAKPSVKRLSQTSLRKITSHDLGLQVYNSTFDSQRSMLMIPKFTPLPHACTKTVYTRYENQTVASLPVTQGGYYFDGDTCDVGMCTRLADVVLRDVPAGPAGRPISVTYTLSDSGILTVKAQDVESGVSVEADVEHPGDMSEEDLARAQAEIGRLEINPLD